MVTWPANMPPPARAFVSRQVELRERLRWTPIGSKRRKRLETELARVVLEELQRETANKPVEFEARQPRQAWWDR